MSGQHAVVPSPQHSLLALPSDLRICVVGAGIGGASAALHLRKGLQLALGVDRLEDLPPGASVAVDVLEASDRIGGRCMQAAFPRRGGHPKTEKEAAKKTADERPEDSVHYECGASIVSEMNEIFLGFARTVQEKRRRSEGNDGLVEALGRTWAGLKLRLFGIKRKIDTANRGDPVPFAIRANFSHWAFRACVGVRRTYFGFAVPLAYRLRLADAATTAALLWKYGFWNLRKLEAVVKKTRGEGAIGLDFRPLYDALDAGEGLATVDALLHRTCGPGETPWSRLVSLLRPTRGPSAVAPAAVARLGALLAGSARDVLFDDFPSSADPLVRELVGANMRCNYGGQGLGDLHGYVGMVSVAGGIVSQCFGIAGGNEGVIRGVLDMAVDRSARSESCVRLRTNTAVTSIRVDQATKKYAVGTQNTSDAAPGARKTEPEALEALYDIVVFAAPLQATADSLASSRANWTNVADLFDPATIPQFRDFRDRSAGSLPAYRRCVATLVQGRMRQEYWRRLSDGSAGEVVWEGLLPLCSVITEEPASPDGADPEEVDIYSCSLLLPTHLETRADTRAWQQYVLEGDRGGDDAGASHAAVWKVFSPEVLDRPQLERMFEVGPGPRAVQTFDWLAYPTYRPARGAMGDASDFFLPFLVQENPGPLPGAGPETVQDRSMGSMLLYVNAIENSASALEMSAIGGKNVANLVVDFVKRKGIAIDAESAERKTKN